MAHQGLSRAPVLFEQKIQGVVSISDIIEKSM